MDGLYAWLVDHRMLAFVVYPPQAGSEGLWGAGVRGQDVPFSLAYAPTAEDAVAAALAAAPTASDKLSARYFVQPATGYLLSVPTRGQPGEGWQEIPEREWYERKKSLVAAQRPVVASAEAGDIDWDEV